MHRIRYLVGSLTLLAAVLGAVWIVRILRNLDDRPGLPLQIEFRDARGLRAGADVRFRGVTVGTVRSVAVGADGAKATASVLLDAAGAEQACVNSVFWIVTPRFGGITGGASGLDTLVRDAYLTFHTPAERGSRLVAGSLLAGREKPPPAADPESLEDVEHGDLLMSVLVPENHGLRPGSAVIFRGQQTGDVRSVDLSPDGTFVEVKLRIARRHRQTVTDRCLFWIARPAVTGALLSGFTLTDVSALLSPYVSYWGEPGKGVPVQDGHRVAALSMRPSFDIAPVPIEALRPKTAPAVGDEQPDDVVVVRVVYAAVERDTWSADDPVRGEGSGVLLLSRDGRALVVTARSLVDGAFTTKDAFGGKSEIENEQLKVMLPRGDVLRAGRVWVHPAGQDLAVLVLEDVPPTLRGTPATRFSFDTAAGDGGQRIVRCAGPDGVPLAAAPFAPTAGDGLLGGAVVTEGVVRGIVGRAAGAAAELAVIPVDVLPEDLRPQ